MLRARDGQILADSESGFATKELCLSSIAMFQNRYRTSAILQATLLEDESVQRLEPPGEGVAMLPPKQRSNLLHFSR